MSPRDLEPAIACTAAVVVAASSSGLPIVCANRSSSLWKSCLCAGSVGALGLVLWLTWPRRPRTSREVVIAALRRLHQECGSVYADLGTLVVDAKLPAVARVPSALDADEVCNKQDEQRERLQQIIEQPLILNDALQEVASRVALEVCPGSTSDDLEADLQRFGEDAEVRRITEDMQEMHLACLEGSSSAVLQAHSAMGEIVWDAESALNMLRELGQAKTECLDALVSEALATGVCNVGSTASGPQLGLAAISACAEVENEVWQRRWPDDRNRRCSFVLELERLSFSDSRFRRRRADLEQELEKLTLAAIANLVQR